MSEDPPIVGSEGNPGQTSIRKLRLKMPSKASTSETIRFPSPSFTPERQELEDDPLADEDDPFVSPADPRIANPKDNADVPKDNSTVSLEDFDDSSSLPELPCTPVNAKAPTEGLQSRLRKRTDSVPSLPPAKRICAEETQQDRELPGGKEPRKRRPGVKGSSPKAGIATQTAAKGANPKPKKHRRGGTKRARSTSSASDSPPAATLVIGIDIEVVEEASARQRKFKEKEQVTKFDAFEIDSSTSWATVLTKVAEKVHTEVGCLRRDTFFWRPSQPKNAEERALNSEEAWKICVKRVELKPKSPFIVIRMAPPNPPQRQLSWAPPTRPGPSTASTSAEGSRGFAPADSDPPSPIASGTSATPLPPSIGSTDSILNPIIQKLQAMYPVGSCTEHPTRHCFYHAATRRHYAVEGLAAKAWATQIHYRKTDYYRIPASAHFHPSKALPTAPAADSTAQPQSVPHPNMPGPGGTPYPGTPTAPLSHNLFMSPFSSFNPFTMYGFSPQPQFAPAGPSISTPVGKPATTVFDGPLSSPPKGMTLRIWCTKYKLDDDQYDGLVKLGFKIGMGLDDIPEEEWKEAGFTRLTWKQAFSAAAAYRADRVRAKADV